MMYWPLVSEILQLETTREVSHSIPECNGQHQPSSLADSVVSIEAADIDAPPHIESAASTPLEIPAFLFRDSNNRVPVASTRVEPKSVAAGDGHG